MTRSDLDVDGSGWTPRVASFYSRSAPGYEELWAPELLKMSRELVEALSLETARRILDLGSGVGTLLPEIQRQAPDALVIGSDLAHGMLRRAPVSFARVTADAQRLPFADASFDVAILAFMLFHVPEPPRALAETRRVLHEDSSIGTLTWGDDPSYMALDIWNDELEARGADAAPALARHELVDTEEKVEQVLSEAGFGDIRTWIRIREDQMTLESFLRHRTGHGMSRHRFESLSEADRADVLEKVRERLADLGPKAFLDRSEVIYATAVAA